VPASKFDAVTRDTCVSSGTPGTLLTTFVQVAAPSRLTCRLPSFVPTQTTPLATGDSLIVTAGLLAATTGVFNVWLLGLLLTVASIIGNQVGYVVGAATGPRLFKREDSLLFNKKHLYRAHDFYERRGAATIVIARFMPIIRTFVPVVAGMAQMDHRRYALYNVIGGVAWIWSMLFIGYFLGRYIPGVDQHIESVIAIVVLLSISPGIIGWYRARRA